MSRLERWVNRAATVYGVVAAVVGPVWRRLPRKVQAVVLMVVLFTVVGGWSGMLVSEDPVLNSASNLANDAGNSSDSVTDSYYVVSRNGTVAAVSAEGVLTVSYPDRSVNVSPSSVTVVAARGPAAYNLTSQPEVMCYANVTQNWKAARSDVVGSNVLVLPRNDTVGSSPLEARVVVSESQRPVSAEWLQSGYATIDEAASLDESADVLQNASRTGQQSGAGIWGCAGA